MGGGELGGGGLRYKGPATGLSLRSRAQGKGSTVTRAAEARPVVTFVFISLSTFRGSVLVTVLRAPGLHNRSARTRPEAAQRSDSLRIQRLVPLRGCTQTPALPRARGERGLTCVISPGPRAGSWDSEAPPRCLHPQTRLCAVSVAAGAVGSLLHHGALRASPTGRPGRCCPGSRRGAAPPGVGEDGALRQGPVQEGDQGSHAPGAGRVFPQAPPCPLSGTSQQPRRTHEQLVPVHAKGGGAQRFSLSWRNRACPSAGPS